MRKCLYYRLLEDWHIARDFNEHRRLTLRNGDSLQIIHNRRFHDTHTKLMLLMYNHLSKGAYTYSIFGIYNRAHIPTLLLLEQITLK